ncbi:hypothetical protein HDU97_009839 [Phlyctochytrium planicorne]|nr:hypothetical protein HDU97_009839 [Phlyctochytrium planicorne]
MEADSKPQSIQISVGEVTESKDLPLPLLSTGKDSLIPKNPSPLSLGASIDSESKDDLPLSALGSPINQRRLRSLSRSESRKGSVSGDQKSVGGEEDAKTPNATVAAESIRTGTQSPASQSKRSSVVALDEERRGSHTHGDEKTSTISLPNAIPTNESLQAIGDPFHQSIAGSVIHMLQLRLQEWMLSTSKELAALSTVALETNSRVDDIQAKILGKTGGGAIKIDNGSEIGSRAPSIHDDRDSNYTVSSVRLHHGSSIKGESQHLHGSGSTTPRSANGQSPQMPRRGTQSSNSLQSHLQVITN